MSDNKKIIEKPEKIIAMQRTNEQFKRKGFQTILLSVDYHITTDQGEYDISDFNIAGKTVPIVGMYISSKKYNSGYGSTYVVSRYGR